jgi:tetratricopeptide (TPR) repeat protein
MRPEELPASWPRRFACAIALGAGLLASSTGRWDDPRAASRSWHFDVLLDGKSIGRQDFTVEDSTNSVDVIGHARFDERFAGFVVYQYEVLDFIQVRRDRLPEAEAAARRVLEITPTYGAGRYFLGLVLIARGEREAALAAMQQETLEGNQLGGLAIAFFALGRKAESDAALARMIKEEDDFPFNVAEAYAFRSETEKALRWLDEAYAHKDTSLYFIKGDPPLKHLEADPRFKAFLRKMNLPE